MIGIYKITSPSGRVYIGQSINIKKRFREYKSLTNCSGQTKLYNSFKKYGWANHTFDVITECDISELNDLERYYQDLYNVIHYKHGLNCLLTKSSDKSGKMSDETKARVSKAKKGVKFSEERKLALIGLRAGEKHHYFGKERDIETKIKISISLTGKKQTEETKGKRGIYNSRGKSSSAKKVINTKTGQVFNCAKDAAESAQINYNTFSHYLCGFRKNKTDFKYLE